MTGVQTCALPIYYPDFVAEMLCWPAFSGWNDYPDTAVSFCELYGIDLKKTEEEVRSKYESEKKQQDVAPVETKPAVVETKPAASEMEVPKKKRSKARPETKVAPVAASNEPPNILTDDGCSMKVTMKDVKPEDESAARLALQKLGGKLFSKGK